MRKTSGIYSITSPSGKQYIGQAQCVRTRWWEHRKYLRLGTHHCVGLQNAYAKYGEDALVFSVIATVPLEQLNEREQEEIDARHKDMLYNTALFVRRPRLGLRHSEESRAKMATAAKNRSLEYRQKLAAGRIGKFHTPEMKKAMSAAFTGEGHPHWGMKRSPEAVAKMKAAQQNRGPEWRARIAAGKLGAKHPAARRVVCLDLGLTFDTARLAASWLSPGDQIKSIAGVIGRACKSHKKIAYGLQWQFADSAMDAY